MATAKRTTAPVVHSADAKLLERVRLTVHAENFIVHVAYRLTHREIGVFITLVQFSAIRPLPHALRDIAKLIRMGPSVFEKTWNEIAHLFILTPDGWVLRPNDIVSAKVMYATSDRMPLRHLFARLAEFWGRACVYCGLPVPRLAIEHIVPKARGGGDELTNLTLACRSCNSRKGTKTAAEFGHPSIHERARGLH